MSSIVLSGDTSGTVTVAVPAVAGTNTVTIAAQTGTLNAAGPAFSAYLSSNQSMSSGATVKVLCNTKEFDTNSNYDNATNYRFTPTVAGYYQVNARLDNGASISPSQCSATIYKNGSAFKRGVDLGLTSAQFGLGASVSCLVYCNGSTDYLEFYASITAASAVINSGVSTTYFQASLVRGA